MRARLVMSIFHDPLFGGSPDLFPGCHVLFPRVSELKRPGSAMFPQEWFLMAAAKTKARASAKSATRKSAAKKALVKYQTMRDFTQTAEPSGKDRVAAGKALRFVV